MKIIEITAGNALHYHHKPQPCHWDLNVYRGCGHRCRYCFAHYSHRWMNSTSFYDDIFVKTNIAECLLQQISALKWQKTPIAVGGVTDSYQPLERYYRLMRDVLKVFIEYPNPVVLVTKSNLILRDLDLIAQLCNKTEVYAGTSLSTVDDRLGTVLEPGASPPSSRLKMLQQLQAVGCYTTVLFMPIIPGLTDNPGQLEAVYRCVSRAGVDSLIPGLLGLKGATADEFTGFLKRYYPEQLDLYQSLYRNGKLDRNYCIKKHRFLSTLQKQFNLDYAPNLNVSQSTEKQMNLFDAY